MPPQYSDLGRVRIRQLEPVCQPVRHRVAKHQDRSSHGAFSLGIGFLRRRRLGIIYRRRRSLRLVLLPLRGRFVPLERSALPAVLERRAIVKEKLGTGGGRSEREQRHYQSCFSSEQSGGAPKHERVA